MKVLLNVARELVGTEEWRACEGLKLCELADGSSELLVTTDVVAAQAADERARELLAEIKGDG